MAESYIIKASTEEIRAVTDKLEAEKNKMESIMNDMHSKVMIFRTITRAMQEQSLLPSMKRCPRT